MCKAYGSGIIVQVHATWVNNSTSKDIFPPLSLEYDRCGSGDQTFRPKFNEFDAHLSFLSYLGMVTSLTLICLCYWCFSKCCPKRRPKFSKWWKDNNRFTIIVLSLRLYIQPIQLTNVRNFQNGGTTIIAAPWLYLSLRFYVQPIQLRTVWNVSSKCQPRHSLTDNLEATESESSACVLQLCKLSIR